MKLLIAALALVLSATAASRLRAQGVEGLVTAQSASSVEEVTRAIQQAIEANDNLELVTRFDHAANAARVGLSLPPAMLILFQNARLGTPLIQNARTSGIDLPQKILVWQDAEGQVRAAYNSTDYLVARHGITLPQEQTTTIESGLRALLEAVSGGEANPTPASDITVQDGLIVRPIRDSVDKAVERLAQAVFFSPNLRYAGMVDHAANAREVDQSLPSTVLLLVDNPKAGTPLMQAAHSIGIDLPQKILLYEDAQGHPFVAYNDPAYLARRHGIEGQEEILGNIATSLSQLADIAAGDRPGGS